jgi:hypothetical protein
LNKLSVLRTGYKIIAMKKFVGISLPVILLLNYMPGGSLSLAPDCFRYLPIAIGMPLALQTDSNKIEHTLDGSTTEWPDTLFENDKGTTISYAVDNDANGLFVGMRIPDFPEQIKIMRMGMKMFIDLKGKKKENMGIEFPVKSALSPGAGTGPAESGEGMKERMRSSLMLNMIFLRVFGVEGQDETQNKGLMMNGNANIAFTWDTADVMHIEYLVPLAMLGDIKSLQDKTISIGWKINGMDISSTTTTSVTPTGVSGSGRRSSGRSGARTTGSPTGTSGVPSRESFDKMMKEQNIWTKYTFTFPFK